MLQLVERGQRSLDDKLPAVLPQTITTRVANADAITIRMLLNHTSGIPEFSTDAFDAELLQNPARVWTLDEHLDRAAAQPPLFAPGAGWSYSNTNYLLLGEILAATTGQPWRRVLAERVFARAELEDTSLPVDGEHTCARCSHGYEFIDGKPIDVTEIDPSMSGAAGGASLVTTTRDLAKLVRALAGGKLFDKTETLQSMLAFVDAPLPAEAQTGYGLGVTRFRTGDIELVGHLGGTAGYQSFVFIHPSSGIVASGYMNRRGDFGAFIMPVLEALARLP
jgi:D-alanyl-D-alanine carboxypeptidase